MKKNINVRKVVFAGILAALYAALTMTLGIISYGPIQFRIAEALTVLPFFFPFTIWGLFVGCIIANIMSPYMILDMIFGSLASLMAGLCTMKIGKIARGRVSMKVLACFPPVIFNAVIIGAMIAYIVVGFGDSYAFLTAFVTFGLQVGFGQLVVLYVLGLPILIYLPKSKAFDKMREYFSQ